MLAVFLSSRFPIRPSLPLYAVLVATLLLAYFVPQEWFLSIDVLPVRYALASLVRSSRCSSPIWSSLVRSRAPA